jgi:hypothetical protein
MEITIPAKATASAVIRAGPFIFVSFSFRLVPIDAHALILMKLAAAGRFRNQDERILLLFSARMDCPRTKPPTLKKTGALQTHSPCFTNLNIGCHAASAIKIRLIPNCLRRLPRPEKPPPNG